MRRYIVGGFGHGYKVLDRKAIALMRTIVCAGSKSSCCSRPLPAWTCGDRMRSSRSTTTTKTSDRDSLPIRLMPKKRIPRRKLGRAVINKKKGGSIDGTDSRNCSTREEQDRRLPIREMTTSKLIRPYRRTEVSIAVDLSSVDMQDFVLLLLSGNIRRRGTAMMPDNLRYRLRNYYERALSV